MTETHASAPADSEFQPAQEIVDELQAVTALPREAKAALLAWTSELGPVWGYTWSPFLCLFGFHQWTGSLATFPNWSGAVVGGKTTHAAGPWQFQPATYAEIVAMTGRPGFYPADQLANAWVLGVRDFGTRTHGGDLLAALKAGQFDQVSTALQATWLAGADQGFGDRYTAVLPLFANPPPPPPPLPPSPPPPPMTPTHTITLRLGMQESFPIAGTDQDGQPFTPPDALQSDDTKVCTVAIAAAADGAIATIAAVGLGQTLVHGADLAIVANVEAQQLAHLVADWSKAVISKIPAAMAAMAVMVALAGSTDPTMSRFAPSIEASKSYMAELPTPPVRSTRPMDRQVDREPSKIGDPDFCLASGNLAAMERCLAWTAALSSR
jgi:hypothetical protein